MADAALPAFDALWDYSDPAGTAAKFQALLAAQQDMASAAWQAQLLSQLARTHSLRADFATAHALLDSAETLLLESAQTALPDAQTTLALVRIALERGRCYNSSGTPAESIPYFTTALELAEPAGLDNLAVDAEHMLAIAEPGEAGLAWNERAAAMAEASADPQARKWLGALLNNQAWGLHELGRYSEALEWFERALAWQQEHGKPRGVEIARWCIARCLRSLGRTAEALELQQALSAEIVAREGSGDDAYVSEELGECLLALGRAADATPHFARAYSLLSADALFAAQHPDRLARLKQLG